MGLAGHKAGQNWPKNVKNDQQNCSSRIVGGSNSYHMGHHPPCFHEIISTETSVVSILRLTSLSGTHTMTMEGLSTYSTCESPSERTKTAIVRAILGGLFGVQESHFEANIGMNG